MSEFLDQLRAILETTPHISKEEKEAANRLISQYRNKTLVRNSGPCIHCKKDTPYLPCRTHLARGDVWLDNLFDVWLTDVQISAEMYRQKVIVRYNAFMPSTVTGYMCDDCKAAILAMGNAEAEALARDYNAQVKIQREKNKDDRQRIIRGEISASPSARFRALTEMMKPEMSEELKQLPYDQFLDSIYWDIVRKYKLYRSHYKCQLCKQDGKLHVHHTTYNHRGEEYNYLDDLIVLCEGCHSKFHDKVLDDEPEQTQG